MREAAIRRHRRGERWIKLVAAVLFGSLAGATLFAKQANGDVARRPVVRKP